MAYILHNEDLDEQFVYEPLSCGDSNSSLLTECMPQLASLIPAECMHYDITVPSDIFQDGSDHSSSCGDFTNNNIEIHDFGKGISLINNNMCGLIDVSNNVAVGSSFDTQNITLDAQDDPTVINIDSCSVSLDESNLFDGIAAHDMGSLLEQFEEAASSLPDLDFDIQTAFEESSGEISPSNSVGESLQLEESEVMKLLKLKTDKPPNAVAYSAPSTPPSTPPNSIKLKIVNSASKGRRSILLPTAVPRIGERGRPRKSSKMSGSHKSQRATQSMPSSPQAPLSPAHRGSAVVKALLTNSETAEAVKALMAKNPNSNLLSAETENENLKDVIKDHDYCQHSSSNNEGKSGTDESEDEEVNVVDEDEDGSVLKSLLLNKNLAEELKNRTAEERLKRQKGGQTKLSAKPGLHRVHSAPQMSKLLKGTGFSQKNKPIKPDVAKSKQVPSKTLPQKLKSVTHLKLSAENSKVNITKYKSMLQKSVTETGPQKPSESKLTLQNSQITSLGKVPQVAQKPRLPILDNISLEKSNKVTGPNITKVEKKMESSVKEKIVETPAVNKNNKEAKITKYTSSDSADPVKSSCEKLDKEMFNSVDISEKVKESTASNQSGTKKVTLTIDELIAIDMAKADLVPNPIKIAKESSPLILSRSSSPFASKNSSPLASRSNSPLTVFIDQSHAQEDSTGKPPVTLAPFNIEEAKKVSLLNSEHANRKRTESANRELVDMEVDDETEKCERYDKFKNESDANGIKNENNSALLVPPPGEVNSFSRGINVDLAEIKTNKAAAVSDKRGHPKTKKLKQNYRGRHYSPPAEITQEDYFNKLPNYFTSISNPNTIQTKKMDTFTKMVDNSVPEVDRDPSPDRDEPVFNKLPDYFSCFTNSTKYDDMSVPVPPKMHDPLGLDADLGELNPTGSRTSSIHSSRSHTPTLVIASTANSCSKPGSRVVSRSNSPSVSPSHLNRSKLKSTRGRHKKSRSRSCSRNRSHCRSNSGSHSGERHSRSRSRHRHLRRRRRRRHSHHRKSRYSSSRSRSRSYSRSRSRSRIRSRHSSRSSSPSSSQSYSWRRSNHSKRSRRSSYSRERSWERAKEREQRERELKKKKQIEERKIVYVGRIPHKFTRHDLRRQFERFGEIEEVSVHFRDHGGDHYGFVTFEYTCDAFAAIEQGNRVKGMEQYDLCFGGRRQFCDTVYEDLDGNREIEEEMAPVACRRSDALDFDELLKQSLQKAKRSACQ